MAEMPDWDALFPGCYNADDFDGGREATVKIKTIAKEALTVIGAGAKPTGEKEEKWCMLFDGAEKKLVLNKTNTALIGAMLGKKTSAWIGKRITLHAEDGCGFGKAGVRVCGSPDIKADVRATIGLMPNPKRVYVLRKTGGTAQAPDLSTVLADADLTLADLDRWRAADGKPATDTLTDDQRGQLAAMLGPKHIAAIRALIPQE